MFNEDIDISVSSNRHYAVEILPKRYVILIILNMFSYFKIMIIKRNNQNY